MSKVCSTNQNHNPHRDGSSTQPPPSKTAAKPFQQSVPPFGKFPLNSTSGLKAKGHLSPDIGRKERRGGRHNRMITNKRKKRETASGPEREKPEWIDQKGWMSKETSGGLNIRHPIPMISEGIGCLSTNPAETSDTSPR